MTTKWLVLVKRCAVTAYGQKLLSSLELGVAVHEVSTNPFDQVVGAALVSTMAWLRSVILSARYDIIRRLVTDGYWLIAGYGHATWRW